MATTVLLVAAAATAATRQAAFPRADEPILSPPPATPTRLVGGWCGPELRCTRTADALGWTVTPDAALADLDAGRWVGRSSAELIDTEPGAFLSWLRNPSSPAPDGESFADLVTRVARWADGQDWPDGRAALVLPPMTVRAAVLAFTGWPVTAGSAIDVAPLDVFSLRGTPGRWRLRAGRNLDGER